MDGRHGQLLAEVLEMAMWPDLKAFTLRQYESLGDEVVAGVIDSLRKGQYKHFKTLDLFKMGMRTASAQALTTALRSESMLHLQESNVGLNEIVSVDMRDIANALRTCTDLQSLEICWLGDCSAYYAAIADGAWPHLTTLSVFLNYGRDFTVLSSALAAPGAAQSLQTLSL